jgi:hypothetical protein
MGKDTAAITRDIPCPTNLSVRPGIPGETIRALFRTATTPRLSPEVCHMSIGTLVAIAAVFAGYFLARNFVRRRLRFVDAAQSSFAPLVAGLLGAALASPLALLPTVTGWTAIMFGVGTALGTSSARRFLRRADWELRRLAP